ARTLSAFQAASEQRMGNQIQGALTEAERAATDTAFARMLDRVATQLGGQADVRSVFANPVTKEGVTVIPVARAFGGFGGGARADGGGDTAPGGGGRADREGDTSTGSGMGVGGGFGAVPVGFIEIDKHGARFRRIDNRVDS